MALFLVTGGAGFIGSNLVEHLVQRGEKVRIIDNLATGKRENIRPFLTDVEFVEGDIRDLKLIRKALEGVDYVLHLAALGSISRSVADPIETNSHNVDGTLSMLVASRERGVKRFVYASSSSVYGNTGTRPKDESLSPMPCSPYGVSKHVGEQYCRIFSDIYGLPTVVLRYFNVFGKRQDPSSQYAAVIPTFVSSLLEGECPSIFGDGEQTRDFTYVDNVVQANLKACSPHMNVFGEVFNIACGATCSVNTLYGKIADLLGSSKKAQYRDARKGEVKNSFADIGKARSILEYVPEIGLDEGLTRTVSWYREQKESVSSLS
jgi:nucleoside-diphosphate-sugar epimerase